MAEEKILDNEKLTEEELDAVAGGADWEIQEDASRLRGMGRLPHRLVTTEEVNNAMWQLGQDLGINLGCDLKEGKERNRYYINHKKKTHEEVWDYIYKHYNGGKY